MSPAQRVRAPHRNVRRVRKVRICRRCAVELFARGSLTHAAARAAVKSSAGTAPRKAPARHPTGVSLAHPRATAATRRRGGARWPGTPSSTPLTSRTGARRARRHRASTSSASTKTSFNVSPRSLAYLYRRGPTLRGSALQQIAGFPLIHVRAPKYCMHAHAAFDALSAM